MSARDESAPKSELERLQRWMQAVITHPGGVGAGVASEEARRSIDADAATLETIVSPSAKLDGAGRLAVYGRSYHARLVECFRQMFPALLRALGENLFDLFALDYLRRHPPRSYTLDRLADDFAQHLAETRPDAAAPPRERESWPDFVVELATLEWAFLKIYDGPGVEGRALPRAVDVRALEDERLLASVPRPAPCLRLFAFSHPVHAYMLAARRGESPEPPAPAETFVAATRVDYRVNLYELSAPQYALLHALDGRHSLGRALERAARASGRAAEVEAARGWLSEWAGRGFFETV
ncbi:MAG TPA: DNA-binding domain-containing protein [Pyrinomonadaceae bacterium]|nr:DNA-binding domain-containing protein [Pyrinomonadaceae bacterium]